MNQETAAPADRLSGPASKLVGLYQGLLRRTVEHFFPDALLDAVGDRSVIDWNGPVTDEHYRLADDPEGLGLVLDWFGTSYTLQPGSPTPFLPAERRLIEIMVRTLDLRFRGLFDLNAAHRAERFDYALEDLIVTEYLNPPDPFRVPAVLEALRVAALSTYENRRVSMGALLLGTQNDPAAPHWMNPQGAPRFNTRLTAIKGFHRLGDGLATAFIVDRQGELGRIVDLARWTRRTQGDCQLVDPCPRDYIHHARATRSGGHVCLLLTPSQEIKVFARGTMAFSFSDARWRILDIPTKFAAWCRAISTTCPSDLALKLFQAALNLAEDRKGGLFVVLRDPAKSVPQLIAPRDRIIEDVIADDPQDPENLSPRLSKRVLHHVVRGRSLADLESPELEALAGIDGAVVTDLQGRLLTFGAILRIDPDALKVARAVEGARTLAAIAGSFHGPALKVSEDGFLTMYLGGRRVWDL
jgi:hypothetical protein